MTLFSLDGTQISVATSDVASVPLAVPAIPPTIQQGGGAEPFSRWWLIVVGAPVYFSMAGAATNANAVLPVGLLPLPVRLAPGATLNVLATAGVGQVSLIQAKIAI